ncbi:HEPN domain-containing protein [Nocardia tengchongensis]
MPSLRYQQLRRRISELRANLLPRTFDPTGNYTSRVHDRTLSFRVLAHAEFESFIEERAQEALTLAYTSWKRHRTPSPLIVSLLAYKERIDSEPTSLINPPQRRSLDLNGRVDKARDDLHKYIRVQNHGIKERNLLRILLPLGIEEADIDINWLHTVEAWATQRGETAHQGRKVNWQPDPKQEFQKVVMIRDGFQEIDSLLTKRAKT